VITRRTIISSCRRYRYTLWRQWSADNGARAEAPCPYVNFVMLNPSTADETQDDNTVRRCIDFAQRWGYGALCITNLFAYRARDPDQLPRVNDPIGRFHKLWLIRAARHAGLVVAGWGIHGNYLSQDWHVRALINVHARKQLHCLGFTAEGHPKHPLFLPAITPYRIYPFLH
jgi:hypothetical protein